MPTDTIDLAPFLAASDVVDYRHPAIAALARTLAGGSQADCAKRCYDWVRDRIEHSIDFNRDEVTCIASDVLAVGTGLCYAKSHLLVALLRANGIAAGFCYQRLTLNGPLPPHCTHGYIGVRLDGAWYRCDARGNSKPGMHCEFTPGVENLAYPVQFAGEHEYREVWAQPWPALIEALGRLERMAQYRAAPIDATPPAATPAA